MSWQAVLLDLDQTIIDSRASIIESFRHAFRTKLGREISLAEIDRVYGRPLERQMAELASPEQADELIRAFRDHLTTLDHLIGLFPDWTEVLTELRRRGYRLAIVTSKAKSAAERHLKLHDLRKLVDAVVTADDTTRHKPDPTPFYLAARSLGVEAASCLVVGDSPWDIMAGNRAGMETALAKWGMFDPTAFEREDARPDRTVDSPAALMAICPPLDGRA